MGDLDRVDRFDMNNYLESPLDEISVVSGLAPCLICFDNKIFVKFCINTRLESEIMLWQQKFPPVAGFLWLPNFLIFLWQIRCFKKNNQTIQFRDFQFKIFTRRRQIMNTIASFLSIVLQRVNNLEFIKFYSTTFNVFSPYFQNVLIFKVTSFFFEGFWRLIWDV